jgi:hypothetical protein
MCFYRLKELQQYIDSGNYKLALVDKSQGAGSLHNFELDVIKL